MGSAGWYQFLKTSGFWKQRKKLYKMSWGFFWIINIAALLVITTTYSKRARVESMSYLSRYEGISRILIENTNQYDINLLPMYYLGQWVNYLEVSKLNPADQISESFISNKAAGPDFFIFEGEENIDTRVENLKMIFPDMVFETIIYPGMIDRIMFWLNPVNENQIVYIYRNSYLHPDKKE
jgi:hypothetical protein